MIRLLLLTCIISCCFFPDKTAATPLEVAKNPTTDWPTGIGSTKVPWVKNAGQYRADILYYAPTFTGNVIVNAARDLLYALPVDSTSGYVLKESFVGQTKSPTDVFPRGEQKEVTRFNYFKGNDPSAWQTNVPAYEVLHMGEIWEGVQVRLRAYHDNVEKLYYIAPHTDPAIIQMQIAGAEALQIASDGRLAVVTPVGKLFYSAPVAFQWIDGEKRMVEVAYHINQNKKHTYAFAVKAYDPNYELVIDPLVASTFMGDGGNDWGNAIATDEAGHVFVTGYTWSNNFPSTEGSYSGSFNGVKDAYVAKFTNDLSTLLVSTFIGGSSWENGNAITISATGEVIVSGGTGSANFPIAGTSYDNTYNGGSNDVFVCKFDNDLSSMLASTFIGGSDDDYGYDLTLDPAGNVFVTGRTESTDYPTTGGFDGTFNGGFEDVFVSKLNNSLSALLASTYLGGSTDEGADAIVTDEAGNVFVTGFTYSDDFPMAGLSFDSTHNGSGDIYIAKFNNNLSVLAAATFIGGTNFEESHAIALDSSQNVFIAGYTGSPEYPSTAGVYDDAHNGNHDAIITKLTNDLSTILAATFIGGTNDDNCYGLVIEGAENVFITGISFSTDYPTTGNAFDGTHNGERDIFVSRFSFDLAELIESTYLGGGENDWALDLTIDHAGSVFVGGGTYSGNFPIQGSPYDDAYNGGEDAVIAKIVGCGVNDFCDPDLAFGALLLDIERDSVYTQGCSATASPGPMGEGGCFDFPAATVWYRFTPETDRDCIKIALVSDELPQPQMAVFEGDCPQNMASLPFACASGTGGELTIHMGVEAEVTYYLAISDATGAEGYFDLYLENSPADALTVDVFANDLQCFESGDGIIDLSVENGTGALQYDWNADTLDGTQTTNSLAIGTYLITVTDENNCVDRTDTITLTQPEQIFVTLNLPAATILYGDTIIAEAVPSIAEVAVAETYWFPTHTLADTATAALLAQPITPLHTDDIIVILQDTSGCIAMDTSQIIVSRRFPYYIPTAFAPESPHPENAVFRPFGTNKIKRVNALRVFTRWGTLLYEERNFAIDELSTGWDGSFKGQLMDAGLYVYSLEMLFIDGSVRRYAGEVMLMR